MTFFMTLQNFTVSISKKESILKNHFNVLIFNYFSYVALI